MDKIHCNSTNGLSANSKLTKSIGERIEGSRVRFGEKNSHLNIKLGSRMDKKMSAPLLPILKIDLFFDRLSKESPCPKTELFYTNPYTLLVAVVLSARATDAGVNKVTPTLFKVANSPQQMLSLGFESLKDHVRTIGLYPTKAKNIIALSQLLVDRHGGNVPSARETLEALAGVGRKTANVVLNVAFGQETIAVDTHVFRVSNRTGLFPGKTPLEVEKGLEKRIPAKWRRQAHHWLLLHGRYICKAQKPRCAVCPVQDICLYPEKTKIENSQ